MRDGVSARLGQWRDPVQRVSLPADALPGRRLAKRSPEGYWIMLGSPADWLRFSRFSDPIRPDAASRQEWQIVQSQLDLRDLLP